MNIATLERILKLLFNESYNGKITEITAYTDEKVGLGYIEFKIDNCRKIEYLINLQNNKIF